MADDLTTIALPLIGVLVGFSLGQVVEWLKSRKRSNRIKRALLNELSVIHEAISRAAEASQRPGIMGLGISLYDVPFITETYDSLRTKIASSVSTSTLAKLQSAYRFISEMNESSDNSVNFGYTRVVGTTDYIYAERDSILKVNDLIEEAIDSLSGELKNTLRAQTPAAATCIILAVTAYGLWFIYWNLTWFMQIPRPFAPANSSLPLLELSPLGAALFVAIGGLVAPLAGIAKIDDKIEKGGLGVTLLLVACTLFLIFLKYGMVAPLELLDSVFTLLYVCAFCMVVFVTSVIIARLF